VTGQREHEAYLFLVDDGERVALVRAPSARHALTTAAAPTAHAVLVDPEGEPMILWVQGEPIGIRE
jgi:hypothetical protein